MTEDEAKQKVCPQTMQGNVMGEGIIVARCVGSACMAWRSGGGNVRVAPSPLTGRPVEITSPAYGFCGLAGQP